MKRQIAETLFGKDDDADEGWGGAAEATQEERSGVALSPENARLRWLTDGKAERMEAAG
jgi:hypothetical protein